jgi:hypothetical protein
MKIGDSLKDSDSTPEVVLRQWLKSVPSLRIVAIASVAMAPSAVRRVAVRLEVSGRARDLDCAILETVNRATFAKRHLRLRRSRPSGRSGPPLA